MKRLRRASVIGCDGQGRRDMGLVDQEGLNAGLAGQRRVVATYKTQQACMKATQQQVSSGRIAIVPRHRA
jgi:hypothetical protein